MVDSILNKRFLISDKYGIGGSDWYVSFEPNGTRIDMVQENIKDSKITNFSLTYKTSNDRIYLFLDGDSSWKLMIVKDKLWVAGQGGAMDFQMTLVWTRVEL